MHRTMLGTSRRITSLVGRTSARRAPAVWAVLAAWVGAVAAVVAAMGASRCAALADQAAQTAAQSVNLLPNPDFETAEGDRPAHWTTHVWNGQGEFAHADGGRGGSRAVVIRSTDGGDLSWTIEVPVEPEATYRLSGWIRTENLSPGTGRGALLNVHELQGTAATPAVSGTSDWRQVASVVRVGAREKITVNCLLGGWGLSKGAAWFDDVRLEKIDLSSLEPVVTIHADRSGPAINPFIYGQFIEHLGRCIYGGIWAEMLEDRKFFFPVTAEYNPYRGRRLDHPDFIPVVGASPWQIIGPADGVAMEEKQPMVGRHAVRLADGAGIRQRDLALVEGKAYEGYVWLKAADGQPRVEVALVWGEQPESRQTARFENLTAEYAKYSLRFTAGASTDGAMFEIRAAGGPVVVGSASLMPADHVRGMRADTLALLKQLGATMYRWPGGNFVSGYNWRDGIGPRDFRPPRKNPAWTGVEHNDFGLDEFVDFCREVGAEPVIAVNTGFGDAYSAAQEVEYANASAETIGGSWRAKNGHPEPYGVKYWCVGNEMWGPWQLGFMQLKHYTLKHNEVAEAMWQVDPTAQLIGCGQLGVVNERNDPGERRDWTRAMLEQCGTRMNYISEHFYRGKNEKDLAAHVRQLADSIRQKADGHRRIQRELGLLPGRPIPIAMDEWNYWHQPYIYGELGCQYDLSDALGVAVGLHEYFRQSDIIAMAHYAQTVNVIGCVKTTKTRAFFDTTALPLMIYRRHFGTKSVPLDGDHELLGLDIAAAWTEDGKTLSVAVVNPNPGPKEIRLAVEGAKTAAEGRAWVIAGDDPRATNDSRQQRVAVGEHSVRLDEGKLRLPAYSVTLLRLDAEPSQAAP